MSQDGWKETATGDSLGLFGRLSTDMSRCLGDPLGEEQSEMTA